MVTISVDESDGSELFILPFKIFCVESLGFLVKLFIFYQDTQVRPLHFYVKLLEKYI